MKNLLLLAISLPLLLGGCGGEKKESVVETKPVEEMPINPNLKYEIKDDEVTITGCDKKASSELTIPATIEGKPVTSIGKDAFRSCSSLTSITIPDSVTSIGEKAFNYCKSLATIEIGAGNVNFTEVNGVLFNAEKTVLLTYPASKEGDNYTIPDSVTSIGDLAFSQCHKLTSITIPDGVTSIGDLAFANCKSLATIEIGAGNVNFTEVNGVLFNAEKTVLLTYPASKEGDNYTIPDSVSSIKIGAFSGCTSLTSITMGESVTSIGELAFIECANLTSITIPDSVTSIGANAFFRCSSLTSITIPDSVTSIGDFAFGLCSGLTSITIGNGLTSIRERTFLQCTSLTSITIPDSVTSIGAQAFKECSGLTSIKIPDGVTSIGKEAFSVCSSLTSITIPDSVTSIGDFAFWLCTSLTAVTFLGDAPTVGKGALAGEPHTFYRKPEAKGWGDTFGGRPVKLISEKP